MKLLTPPLNILKFCPYTKNPVYCRPLQCQFSDYTSHKSHGNFCAGHTCLMKGLVYSARSRADGTAYPVNDVSDAVACQKLCEITHQCNYFTFHNGGYCYLMKTIKSISSSGARARPYTSGYKRCKSRNMFKRSMS